MRYIRIPNGSVILASIILLWLNAGVFSFVQRFIPGILMYVLYGLWLLLSFRQSDHIRELYRWIISFIPVFILLFTALFLTNSSLTRSYISFMIYILIIGSITLRYMCDYESRSFLINIWWFDIGFVVINTFIKIRNNPMLIRNMSANAKVFERLFGGKVYGVAAYSNILSYVVIMLFLFSRIVNKKAKNLFFYWVAVISLLLLILKSQIGLLIIAALIGVFFIGLAGFFKSDRTLIMFGIVNIIIACFLYRFLPYIFIFISRIDFLPDLLKIKANDASMILRGTTTNLADASVRLQQYENDISSFLANPVVGTMGDSTTIGGHATWMDLLGMYGILSIIILIWHFKLMNKVTSCVHKTEKKMVVSIIVLFTLLGIVDPILFQNAYMVFVLVIPFMSMHMHEYTSERANQDEDF